ncbi:aldehyde dehydrogenase family protein [Streptomyces sp. NPDC058000]|uniref:aldehyde dehydrogenase family protein n=1 Tax=Streptomyces sp. NPDC058000 TaxID=3346299 RepID=UPI0036E46308
MSDVRPAQAGPRHWAHYVSGRFDETGVRFPLVHPADGAVIGTVPEADAGTVDRAVRAARSALDGPWGSSTVEERCAVLRRIADGMEARFEEFVAAEVADTGKPASLARSVDIPRGIANFRAYADLAWGRPEQAFATAVPDGTRALNSTVRPSCRARSAVLHSCGPSFARGARYAPRKRTGREFPVESRG